MFFNPFGGPADRALFWGQDVPALLVVGLVGWFLWLVIDWLFIV